MGVRTIGTVHRCNLPDVNAYAPGEVVECEFEPCRKRYYVETFRTAPERMWFAFGGIVDREAAQ